MLDGDRLLQYFSAHVSQFLSAELGFSSRLAPGLRQRLQRQQRHAGLRRSRELARIAAKIINAGHPRLAHPRR
jgi:hypothetical protein